MTEQNSNAVERCVFCGSSSTTRDHVPPKGLFPSPRPPDLITVPSCSKCNNGASEYDEKFRNHVVMQAGQAPQARAVWNQKTLRSIKRNRKEFGRLVQSMRDVDLYSPGGIYLRTATEVKFEAEPHDQTIRKLTRGLYWHHFGAVLPFGSPVEVTVIAAHNDNWTEEVNFLLRFMQRGSVGGPGVFEYFYGRVPDYPTASIWFFEFYGSHVVMASTGLGKFQGESDRMAGPSAKPGPPE